MTHRSKAKARTRQERGARAKVREGHVPGGNRGDLSRGRSHHQKSHESPPCAQGARVLYEANLIFQANVLILVVS